MAVTATITLVEPPPWGGGGRAVDLQELVQPAVCLWSLLRRRIQFWSWRHLQQDLLVYSRPPTSGLVIILSSCLTQLKRRHNRKEWDGRCGQTVRDKETINRTFVVLTCWRWVMQQLPRWAERTVNTNRHSRECGAASCEERQDCTYLDYIHPVPASGQLPLIVWKA